jgi:hypothetical protein
VKIRLGILRRIIREAIDPPKGFYPYDNDILDTKHDLFGRWYRSPGQPPSQGNVHFVDDAYAYIGMHPPGDNAVATPGAASGEIGSDARPEGEQPAEEPQNTDELDPST